MNDYQVSKRDRLIRDLFAHQMALLAYAHAILRDWSLAQDAVQEAFIEIMNRVDEYDPDRGGYAWFKKFVFFKIKRIQSSRSHEFCMDDQELETLVCRALDTHIGETEAQRAQQQERALHLCLGQLREKHRKLITAFYWDHLSCEALAVDWRMTPTSLRMMLSRLRVKLRQCVRRQIQAQEWLS